MNVSNRLRQYIFIVSLLSILVAHSFIMRGGYNDNYQYLVSGDPKSSTSQITLSDDIPSVLRIPQNWYGGFEDDITFDPHTYDNPVNLMLFSILYSPLIEYDVDEQEYIPMLAEIGLQTKIVIFGNLSFEMG